MCCSGESDLYEWRYFQVFTVVCSTSAPARISRKGIERDRLTSRCGVSEKTIEKKANIGIPAKPAMTEVHASSGKDSLSEPAMTFEAELRQGCRRKRIVL
jgi:hypothetical protein